MTKGGTWVQLHRLDQRPARLCQSDIFNKFPQAASTLLKIAPYLRWGLCMCESFIFKHRTFVVAHVESAVTEPHVDLELNRALMFVPGETSF